MSILFGIRKESGDPVQEPELSAIACTTSRWAPDGTFVYAKGPVGMGFQPYHTHPRSKLDSQPTTDECGNVATLDGRLDNHRELCEILGMKDGSASDSLILLAAFRRWGSECFSHLLGEWAAAIWQARDEALYLARDHAGTRTLYFEITARTARWSTYLDTFFNVGTSVSIDREYIAGYLCAIPARHRTPYCGIRSVLPGHYVCVTAGRVVERPHWDWLIDSTLVYKSSSDYDEQFLELFEQAVARRASSSDSLIAHLSGGIDSTSIVCIADHIAHNRPEAFREQLCTLSYYDDTDPNWDEAPYFTAVETLRKKPGIHVRTAFAERSLDPVDPRDGIYRLPGADRTTPQIERSLLEQLKTGGFRSFLCGVGGDELLGGAPDPLPELAAKLTSLALSRYLSAAVAWCLSTRCTLYQMLFRSMSFTISLYYGPRLPESSLPSWVRDDTRKVAKQLVRTDITGQNTLGRSTMALTNARAWWSIMETLPSSYPGWLARYEFRYPYLDRDLVEFLFKVPNQELVRPGTRRLMMRRALRGIVPSVVLDRKRKAFLSRAPLAYLRSNSSRLEEFFKRSLLSELGYVDGAAMHLDARAILNGADYSPVKFLLRAISLELWLRAHFGLKEPRELTSASTRCRGSTSSAMDAIFR